MNETNEMMEGGRIEPERMESERIETGEIENDESEPLFSISVDAPILRSLMNTPKIHALEHATIAVLASRFNRKKFSGLSLPFGFFLIGEASIEEVRDAFDIALSRLKAGETELALSKNCGTNIAVTGALCALTAIAALSGTKSTKERMKRFDLLALSLGFLSRIGPELGMLVQKEITTDPNVAGLNVTEIKQTTIFGHEAYFVKIIESER